jgi:hypothetical protein
MTGRLHVVGLDPQEGEVGLECLEYGEAGERRVAIAITDATLCTLTEFHLDVSAIRALAAFLTEGLT